MSCIDGDIDLDDESIALYQGLWGDPWASE